MIILSFTIHFQETLKSYERIQVSPNPHFLCLVSHGRSLIRGGISLSPFSRRLTRGRSCLHTNFHVSPPFPPGYFSLLMHARISVTRASPLCARGKIIISPGKLVVEFTASRNTRDPRGNLPFFLFLSFFFLHFLYSPSFDSQLHACLDDKTQGEGGRTGRETVARNYFLAYTIVFSPRDIGARVWLYEGITYSIDVRAQTLPHSLVDSFLVWHETNNV